MLQKCYNRNNSVTNVKSGSRIDNVRSGHQIVHAPNGAGTCLRAGATVRLGYIYARDELESWKLKQAGS